MAQNNTAQNNIGAGSVGNTFGKAAAQVSSSQTIGQGNQSQALHSRRSTMLPSTSSGIAQSSIGMGRNS